MVRRCRGDHSRLGYALTLCYLRHPGRPLRTNERPPRALVSFVAGQIDARPALLIAMHESGVSAGAAPYRLAYGAWPTAALLGPALVMALMLILRRMACTPTRDLKLNAEVLIKSPADMNLRPVTTVDLLHQGG
jgi:Domain of unknown function (DUF4158)